ncbi:class F sortase [Candidatus Saccharibacteria bacterium]|nr:class F sortase [Candidatus Saccharibacteria bacterium]
MQEKTKKPAQKRAEATKKRSDASKSRISRSERPKSPETPLKSEKSKSEKSLEIGFSKSTVEKIIIAVLVFILTVFFVKTAIWERKYYSEKEGSERYDATVVDSSSDIEVDETPVTEEQMRAHTVPAEDPRYLSIEKLGISNARVLNISTKSNGELDTPLGIFDVGWYNGSSRPGKGGTIVIDGHNGGPNVVGVFKYLDKLFAGDRIKIERGDGEIFEYEVVDNVEIPLDEADAYMKTAFVSPTPGKESLSLITCTGEWSQLRQTYLSRQFVRAVKI